jgi:hypothetical protein
MSTISNRKSRSTITKEAMKGVRKAMKKRTNIIEIAEEIKMLCSCVINLHVKIFAGETNEDILGT